MWISGTREEKSDSDELIEDFALSEQIAEAQKADLDGINLLITKGEYE